MGGEPELLGHLQTVTGLEASILVKLLEETRAWYAKDFPTWIRDRHRELQRQGMRNADIYPLLREEAGRILVHPEPMTERQIRRVIYG